MTSAQKLQPGTRWFARRGRHAGNEVEITNTTDLSVVFRSLGGGAAMGNQKVDERPYTMAQERFLVMYAPREDAVAVPGTQPAFRRVAQRARKPSIGTSAAQPLALNGVAMTGGTPLTLEVLEVTPAQAQAWLDRSLDKRNRRIADTRVAKLVAAIQRGEWQLTGDSIKLDADSVVRDGRHRLTAIVRAGVPVTSLVVRNVAEPAFDVIDTGASRKPADVLSIHGYKYQIALAAAARGLLTIERFGRYQAPTAEVMALASSPNILAYVQRHEAEMQVALERAAKLQGAKLVGGSGLWTIFFVLVGRVSAEQAGVFADLLAEGAGLDKDNPILRLRNRLISGRMWGSSDKDREAHLAVAIKAWNAWRVDEEIKGLSWHPGAGEAFPVPA